MNYQPFTHSRLILSLSAGFLTTVASVSAHADTILADTFTQNQGTLQNRPVEVPQTTGDTWSIENSSSSNVVVSDGELEVGPNGSFAKAVAPLDVSSITTPYALSFTLSFNPETDTTTQFYGGFGNGTGNGTGFNDYSGGPMFSESVDATGTSFTLDAGNGPGGALTTTITRASTAVPYTMSLEIQFNPTTDVANYLVDGSSIGTTDYAGQIGGLWFKEDVGGPAFTGFDISNLKVVTTPEPSTYALMLGGLLALGAIPRLRRRA